MLAASWFHLNVSLQLLSSLLLPSVHLFFVSATQKSAQLCYSLERFFHLAAPAGEFLIYCPFSLGQHDCLRRFSVLQYSFHFQIEDWIPSIRCSKIGILFYSLNQLKFYNLNWCSCCCLFYNRYKYGYLHSLGILCRAVSWKGLPVLPVWTWLQETCHWSRSCLCWNRQRLQHT